MLHRQTDGMASWRQLLFRLLARHEGTAERYYGLPADHVVEVEIDMEP